MNTRFGLGEKEIRKQQPLLQQVRAVGLVFSYKRKTSPYKKKSVGSVQLKRESNNNNTQFSVFSVGLDWVRFGSSSSSFFTSSSSSSSPKNQILYKQTIADMMGSSSSSPEHQHERAAKKTKLNVEDTISKFSSTADDHPLHGPVFSSVSDDDDDYYYALMTDRIILNDTLSYMSKSYPYPLFPVMFLPTMSISEYVRSFDDLLPSAAQVSLCGMIMNKQTFSKSKFIYELRCLERKAKTEIQVIAEARNSDMDDAGFIRFHSSLQPGYFLGVSGLPGKSENGGLAIFPTSCISLTTEPKKRLPSNPDWVSYCKPMEHESLQLCQDIMRDKEVQPVYTLRYTIVKSIMRHISKYNFIKEKASLNTIVGGRASQSFANDCHILGYSSPSLMIWQDKMSCGSAYAYDLGKKIRNEGIDLSHIPNLVEFELFMDFDYNDLMQLCERTLSEMVKDLTGGYKIKCHANGLHVDPIEIDFKPPFSKIDIMEELDKLENLEKPEDFSSDATNSYLTGACTKYDIKCPPGETNEELLDKVVKHFLEKCVNPTFILYHPNIVSRREKCGFTRHFKLFVNKHVVFNGYAALEDRFSQIQRISHIKDRLLTEDEEIALEHGLVSTGGWSLGIDRLTLLLTDAKCIEEEVPTSKGPKSVTVLFPCSATEAAEGKDVLEESTIRDGLIQSTIQIQEEVPTT